jgi:hypothetical protein
MLVSAVVICIHQLVWIISAVLKSVSASAFHESMNDVRSSRCNMVPIREGLFFMAANLTRNLVVVSWRRIYLMRSVKELYVHTSSRVSTYVSRFMIAGATERKYLRERMNDRDRCTGKRLITMWLLRQLSTATMSPMAWSCYRSCLGQYGHGLCTWLVRIHTFNLGYVDTMRIVLYGGKYCFSRVE